MVYVGRADRTALVSSTLPEKARKFEVAVSLLSIWLTSGAKSTIFGLVVPIGTPRYVKSKLPTWHPKALARSLAFSGVVLSETRQDLTFNPIDCANSSKISLRKSLLADAGMGHHDKDSVICILNDWKIIACCCWYG